MNLEEAQQAYREKYDPSQHAGRTYDEYTQYLHDKMFKNPYPHFDGTYQFKEGFFDGITDGLTGYASGGAVDQGDFGEGPSEVYHVFFKEFPGQRYVAYEYPPRNGEVESTGTFTPWQLELPFDD